MIKKRIDGCILEDGKIISGIEKNPDAQDLVRIRWKKTTAQERSETLAEVSKAGWTGANREARLLNAGRPLDKDRCP